MPSESVYYINETTHCGEPCFCVSNENGEILKLCSTMEEARHFVESML